MFIGTRIYSSHCSYYLQNPFIYKANRNNINGIIIDADGGGDSDNNCNINNCSNNNNNNYKDNIENNMYIYEAYVFNKAPISCCFTKHEQSFQNSIPNFTKTILGINFIDKASTFFHQQCSIHTFIHIYMCAWFGLVIALLMAFHIGLVVRMSVSGYRG